MMEEPTTEELHIMAMDFLRQAKAYILVAYMPEESEPLKVVIEETRINGVEQCGLRAIAAEIIGNPQDSQEED